MKTTLTKILSLALISSLFCLDGCFLFPNDHKQTLPPATQTGANTLGFLLNGQIWLPNGACRNPISPVYDPSFQGKPEFDMTCFQCSSSGSAVFGFYLRGITKVGVYPISDSLGSCSYGSNICNYYYHDPSVFRKGSITITKFSLPIISGTFDMVLYKTGCDSIKITQGRFDIKL